MNRLWPFHNTVGYYEVGVAHKLDVDAVSPLSTDILPLPFTRCSDMHVSTIISTNSARHVAQLKNTCA